MNLGVQGKETSCVTSLTKAKGKNGPIAIVGSTSVIPTVNGMESHATKQHLGQSDLPWKQWIIRGNNNMNRRSQVIGETGHE